jgi:hypothetical protein
VSWCGCRLKGMSGRMCNGQVWCCKWVAVRSCAALRHGKLALCSWREHNSVPGVRLSRGVPAHNPQPPRHPLSCCPPHLG